MYTTFFQMFWWRNKLIYRLDSLKLSTFWFLGNLLLKYHQKHKVHFHFILTSRSDQHLCCQREPSPLGYQDSQWPWLSIAILFTILCESRWYVLQLHLTVLGLWNSSSSSLFIMNTWQTWKMGFRESEGIDLEIYRFFIVSVCVQIECSDGGCKTGRVWPHSTKGAGFKTSTEFQVTVWFFKRISHSKKENSREDQSQVLGNLILWYSLPPKREAKPGVIWAVTFSTHPAYTLSFGAPLGAWGLNLAWVESSSTP